jgi:apolipoprotein D and lipocalin family protein
MMIYTLLVVLAVLFVTAQGANLRAAFGPPETVKSLDLPAYLGLWYQMASDEVVYATFEKDAYCSTALYGDNGDATISVHNYATIGGPAGTTYLIDGYGYIPDPAEPGQLMVSLTGHNAVPFPTPYWILELGPINKNGLYDYAIVSDNMASTLFVLARDVNTYNSQYRESVSKRLTELGFVGRKAPIDMYQGTDCVYESTLRQAQIKKFQEQQQHK